ncbi:MAG: phosphonatase-like hydrolase [Stackebrandtia sp.]
MNRYDLVCADMAGTTVADDGVVEQAASAALEEHGLSRGAAEHDAAMTYVRDTMGQSKIEVFRAILHDESAAQGANRSFETAFEDLARAGKITALPGAEDVLRRLRENGVKTALTTGFAPSTQAAILEALGWRNLVDLAVAPADGLRGRPFPDMVLHAVLRLSVDDVRRVAVVGDSANDIRSGLRAGAGLVAGVLTGAHDAAALREAGATHILDSVAQLPSALA